MSSSNTTLHVAQIICATVWCFLSAGIIFGFAALKPILIQEGIYSEYCDAVDPPLGNITTPLQPCVKQDLKLNFMFTVSATITNIMALPVGWALDTYGPRICGITGAVVLSLASLSFIASETLKNYVDPYMSGYILLSIAGPFVFISCFQLANCFPGFSGTILAVLTGSFDMSSSLFLGYRLVYQKYAPNLSLRRFFTIYLIVPLFIFVCQVTIMPRDSYKTIGTVAKMGIEVLDETGHLLQGDSGSALIPDEVERTSLLAQDELGESSSGGAGVDEPHAGRVRRKSAVEAYIEGKLQKKSGGIFGILHGLSVLEQIRTPWFYLMLIFTAISMIRLNYFIATVRTQEEWLLQSTEGALKINSIFDVLLPTGGVFGIPLVGLILDGTESLHALYLLFATSITVGILGIIPKSFILNLIGIILFVLFRPFFYTLVSDYSSKVFGFDTFGTVYGLLNCIGGAFNVLQSYLDKWTHTTFKMNPVPMNVLLLIITVLSGGSLVIYVRAQLLRLKANEEMSGPIGQSRTGTTTYGTHGSS